MTRRPSAQDRPKLRPIEAVIVVDKTHGRALMLRDPEGVAERAIVVPTELAPIVSRFDGARTIAQIARDVSAEAGAPIETAFVAELAAELDAALFLDSPKFRARRAERVEEFARAPVRAAWHAGGAYHADAGALKRFIERECLDKAALPSASGHVVGICAPHMDLWRAAIGYGYAYRALEALPADIDTFVLLGTSHAPMRQPFSICDKVFDTPLGPLEPDRDALTELARAARFDVREDEYLHRSEHSLEFQAVFLRHALGARRARIVPVLCGLGGSQARGTDPALDSRAESFTTALAELVERKRDRTLVIAGADLAHVGPRFGDLKPLDGDERVLLEHRDRASIDHALERRERAFFLHVVEDLNVRRICGTGPIYTMLRIMPRSARGELLRYTQCVDPEEGSIVSYASMRFTV